jgi:ABC-2 type transport system permease protein
MAIFRAALCNEIEKLVKKKKALVALILSLLVIVGGQLVIVGVRSGFGLRGVGSLEFSVLVLSVVVNTILPLFTALVVIDCFSGEFAHHMIRVTLTRPVSRLKVFTAKITAIAVFLLANLMLLFILSTLTGYLFNVNSVGWESFVKTFLAYGFSLLPLMVVALGIVLLTNILKSGISVFFLSVLLFLAFKAGGLFFSQYASIFFTTQLDWYNYWLAHAIPWGKILRQLLIMVGYAMMLFTAGFYLFDKKEF